MITTIVSETRTHRRVLTHYRRASGQPPVRIRREVRAARVIDLRS